jgi:putative copper export protein
MRRKTFISTIVLITLTALLLLTGFFTRSAYGSLANPDVNAVPAEAYIGQHVVVQALISVVVG